MKGHLHTKNMSGLAVREGAVGMATMIGIFLTFICLLAACSDHSVIRQPGPVVGAPGAASAPAVTCADADLSRLKRLVYVKADGTDGNSCGLTTDNACKTIQQGINNCAGADCGVLVRHGRYPTTATITLRDAVSVYGSCRFDGEADRKYRTTIQANPAPGTAAISASAINTPTTIFGLVVVGKDETANGTASIAMAVSDSKGLTLSHSVLAAGKGGDGGPVSPAAAATAQNGDTGDSGSFTAGGQGAGGPSCDAGGTAGRGGDGSARRINTLSSCGAFSCDCNESGGLTGSNGGATGSIAGGTGGGSGTQGNACYEHGIFRQGVGGQGNPGNPGSAGACSSQSGIASADVWGRFQAAGWLPGASGAGGSGDVGSGGGGGGPGGMCVLETFDRKSWFPYWGQPGGGGGAGGCAGPGGPGGQQGGASIGLLLAASSIALNAGSMAIMGSQGGSGGQGATGGIGTAGGARGAGGNSGSNCTLYDTHLNLGWGGLGGPGGSGGQGGAGSGGAGGNGGSSVGIALVGGSPAPANVGNIYRGFSAVGAGGGTGGLGGANDCAGATGQHGVPGGVAVVFDAAHPPRNVMTPGQMLHANESLTSPDGRYLLTMQADNNLVLYAVSKGVRSAVWDTHTEASQERPGVATMQTDGNFVVYDANGHVLFPSSTDGHPGASLRVQDDGRVQVVNVDGSLLWYAPCQKPSGGIACSPSRWN